MRLRFDRVGLALNSHIDQRQSVAKATIRVRRLCTETTSAMMLTWSECKICITYGFRWRKEEKALNLLKNSRVSLRRRRLSRRTR
jgi:hypothetical protein